MNPTNRCSHLYSQEVDLDSVTIDSVFAMQRKLQDNLASRGRTVDLATASHMDRVRDITVQWRNMNTEMAELLERLPYKEWKTYTEDQKAGIMTDEERLETLYEFVDVFHFLLNVGLDLGIDAQTFKRLYLTKNKENLDRQTRGY